MKEFFKSLPLLTLGAIIAAVSIEIFLAPNQIIDVGIVGISIMLNYLTNIELGIFTFMLNLPFLILAYTKLGKRFVCSTLYAVAVMSTVLLFHIRPITSEPLLATFFGGSIKL